ncbi:hypothetical protein [Sulfurimonas sp.]|jgi:hypothetical protein|uniref:Eco57I restriction-modification methylase domain-containing protein n=1 Tax=Sulfurimonas sp. TaxID=2022749 RepID=UPI0025F30500|nr:hypothetical protein [Sulfurimonas sp.]MBT5934395.1 class I SAM-dependent DNA methyltransferase [Sulfurimonas sp.]
MNLVGITNENEFYTNHYLNEIFEGDIKEHITSWQEKENESETYKTPFKKLRGIGPGYLELLKDLGKKTNTTQEKLQSTRRFYKTFLDIFGYSFSYETKELDEFSVPLLAQVDKSDGSPYLWIVESYCDESCDVLTSTIVKEQLSELDVCSSELNYDAIITSHIFTLPEPPRWIMLASPYQIVLIERAKWAQKRYLRFDIEDIIARKEDAMLKAVSVLLHTESLASKDGLSLLDTLDENSHKHAFGVTEDLKYSLRSAVELLGNEAIYYHQKNNPAFLQTPNLESDLTRESLRYMYRMLFLFYIESRPELGFIPSKSQAFVKGYSLETLRDLELMPLLTDSDKNGYYFSDSISLYFDMIYNGRVSHKVNMTGKDIFSISPLRSHLFDPDKTPLLNEVKLRNHVWQEIIQSLSLSRVKKGNKGRGRISYANLGINQLGAVYEALLSYKGFIAKETLYEVKKAGTEPTPLENAYFVTENQLSEYKEEERVFNKEDGTIKAYKIGKFIYRLAGRDREKSASYYTPEVLTKSLVKYALKELLEIDDDGRIGKNADEILNLTVCEPAMGSAAFLNEAINQLSEAYLHKKQIETGKKIPHSSYKEKLKNGEVIKHKGYIEELQRVKMHIADNNVYGVDLNPTAVELAEISLWLNALSGSFVPWFGFQLENGNSLIGARREVYETHQLTATKKALIWYEDAPKRLTPTTILKGFKKETQPEKPKQQKFDVFTKPKQQKLDLEETRSAGRKKDTQIYHFLVGDKAMVNYTDKVVKTLKKEKIEHINKWRKEFIKPHVDTEVNVLLKLSLAIDKLWQEQTRHLDDMKKKTTDTLYVWGQPKAKKQQTNIEYKDTVFMQEKLSADVKSSSPYMRLKIVMDYWCSLWFWPIEKAKLLPTRAEFLHDISLLVEKRDDIIMNFDKDLFSDTIDDEIRTTQLTELGFIDVAEQIEKNPRLQVVQDVSAKQKFLHWELEFADVFAKKGGFDLILGNPPWLKVEWEEKGIMGEVNPLFDIRKFTANNLNLLREETLENYPNLLNEYINEYESASATQNFLGSNSNYALLDGKANLYKCFLPLGWNIANTKGICGFLHPEGVYDDPKGGPLRSEIYKRLKYHFQFANGLFLFQEVHDQVRFGINIFANSNKEVDFKIIANLFLPQTIDGSFENFSNEVVGGIKDDNNKWNIEGHQNRILRINKETLKLFVKLYDDEGTLYLQARLPALHSIELISVLEKFSNYSQVLGGINGKYISSVMFDESKYQKENKIEKKSQFIDDINDLILNGVQFHICNILSKTPRKVCTQNSHYDSIDISNVNIDYLPRSNFVPTVDLANNVPSVPWDSTRKFDSFYRVINREMMSSPGERTFISSIIPKNTKHILSCVSTAFEQRSHMLEYISFGASIVGDFFIKSTGMGHTGTNLLRKLILVKDNITADMKVRILILSCLTSHYKELYEDQYEKFFINNSWTKKDDPRLNHNFFTNLTATWQRDIALRTDYERRQALVEIDVLVAQELKLTLEELKTIYRIQFPVLKQNENETFYDMNGRIVFTVSKGLTGVGLPRKAVRTAAPYKIVVSGETTEEKPLGWEDIINMQSGEIHRTIQDDTMPNGPIERTIIYKAPFAKCDREKDYEVAWTEFEKRNNS